MRCMLFSSKEEKSLSTIHVKTHGSEWAMEEESRDE
jgi:hypothetical protein